MFSHLPYGGSHSPSAAFMDRQHPGCGTDLALPMPDSRAAYPPQSGRQHNSLHQGIGAPQTTPEGLKNLVTPRTPATLSRVGRHTHFSCRHPVLRFA